MSRARFAQAAGVFVFAVIAALMLAAQGLARSSPKTSPVPISKEPLPVVIERAFPNLNFPQANPPTSPGITGGVRPIYLTYPPDGTNRIAVMGQLGHVWLFPNKEDVEDATETLDISPSVVYNEKANEEGLLGLAFHPNFKQNREFFVYYTTNDAKHQSVLKRFKMSASDPNRADPNSGEEILRTPEKETWNHNGGTITFGPDGYLYFVVGDGGFANDKWGHGQSLETLLGKINRIDVDHKDSGLNYAIPKDNPFVNVEGARGEIWALGLRNPWRISFDPKTGWLWAGDVGQDTWEEVDIITKGGNYGWNIREGFHPFTVRPNANPKPAPPPEHVVGKLIDPVFDYHHSIGKSITGGGVYRGKRAPELYGKYIFADYVSGKVYALTYDDKAEKTVSVQQLTQEEGRSLPIFTFGEDEHHEMYLGSADGTLKHFRSLGKPAETPTSAAASR